MIIPVKGLVIKCPRAFILTGWEWELMLKITGGYLAGKTIFSLAGQDTRPPLTRIRESVANILRPITEDAEILDLYAGTGSFSFELLSRGSKTVVLTDKNPRAVQILRKNATHLDVVKSVEIVRADALKVIEKLKNVERTFDIVLVAPPYFTGLDQQTMGKLSDGNLLKPDGIVMLQQSRKERFKESYGKLILKKTYRYGETRISTYMREFFG